LLRKLDLERDPALDEIYKGKKDKRALHFDSFDYKEALWQEEQDRDLIGSQGYNHTRDGKCAELVMIWTHHITAKRQSELKQSGLILPLMSTVDHTSVSNGFDKSKTKAKVPAVSWVGIVPVFSLAKNLARRVWTVKTFANT